MNLADFDRLYASRHEAPVLQQCLEAIEQAAPDYEWLWRGARLKHFQAMQSAEADDAKSARSLFQAGSSDANKAMKLDGFRVEATFWSATCGLEAARLGGTLALMTVLSRAQKELHRAARIDEEYHYAGPLRVLGRVVHLKPLAIGGTLDGAIAFFDRARQIAPRNSTTNLYLADALIADRQPKRARQAIKDILENSDSQNWEWETLRDQKTARLWLESRFD